MAAAVSEMISWVDPFADEYATVNWATHIP